MSRGTRVKQLISGRINDQRMLAAFICLCGFASIPAQAQMPELKHDVKSAGINPSTALTVVEYYISSSDSYFLTGRATDQAQLDALPASFKRTGAQFDAFAVPPATAG